jgi:hypothetical protein
VKQYFDDLRISRPPADAGKPHPLLGLLAHAQRVLGVDEDVVLGRAPSWDAPLSEWPEILARQQEVNVR